jgi:hypothetical protein
VNRCVAALVCVLLVSCVPSKRREVDSPSGLGSGEILLIGRVKLTPPVSKDDQNLPGIADDWRGKVMVLIADEYRPLERPFQTSQYKGRIEAPPDREFSVALPAKSFAIRGGVVPLNLYNPTDEALLPGGFQVEILPGDSAVYIGTIHYHRNEFWKVTKIDIEDDYDRVKAACLEKWGASAALRKSIVKPPAGGR